MTDIEIASISLKDYKRSIDELRASMLSLESTSDEYKAIAQEVAKRQSKLNEVMSVGKKDVDAVAGSYNALSKELSRLKSEWKNMEMGTQAWEDMAKKINDINNQLKDADETVGVFSRNVGNYANSFLQAMDGMAGGVGEIGADIKNLIPIITKLKPIIEQLMATTKNAKKEGVGAISAVKKAIGSSKGNFIAMAIAVAIAAIALLIKNWEKLARIFNKQLKYDEELINSSKNLSEAFAEENRQLENRLKIREAEGASYEEIISAKQDLAMAELMETEEVRHNIQARIDAINQHSKFGRWIRGEKKNLKELEEALKGVNEQYETLSDTLEDLVVDEIARTKADAKRKADEAKKAAERVWKAEEDVIKKRNKEISDSYKSDIQKLKEKYNEELALMKKHHKDTKALTSQYNRDVAVLNARQERQNYDTRVEERSLETMGVELMDSKYWKKQFDIAKKNREELEKYVNENFKKIYDANKEVVKREPTEAEVNEIYAMLGVGSKVGFQKALREADIEIRTAIYGLRDALQSEELDAIRETTLVPGTKTEIKNRIEVAEKELEQIKRTGKLASETDNEFNARVAEQIETIEELKKELASFSAAEREFEAQWRELRDGYSLYSGEYGKEFLAYNQLKDYEDVMQTYIDNMKVLDKDGYNIFSKFIGIDKNTEEGYEKWKKIVLQYLVYFPEDARSQYLELLQNLKDEENAILEERVKNWFDMAGQVANIFGSIGSIYDEHIARQKELLKEQGKTDEEANSMLENKFNVMKGFQIAEATINTISGALGAFMGITKDTGGWGIAAAAAQAAAVTIAGIAQIQKIANTTIGKTQNLSAPQVSVTPVIEDYQPQRFQNITTAEDERRLQDMMEKTNIVVNVSDIDRAQKKVRVRSSEASF